jgi:hypothetical protein
MHRTKLPAVAGDPSASTETAGLDRLRQASLDLNVEAGGDGGAAGQGLQRRARPALGEAASLQSEKPGGLAR